MASFVVFFGIAAIAIATGLLAKSAVQPLESAARGNGNAIQFTVVDLLSLFLLLQVVAAPLLVRVEVAGGWGWGVVGLAWCMVGMIWLASVRRLSRAGIMNSWHRFLLQVVVLPGTLLATLLLPAAAVWLLLTIVYPRQDSSSDLSASVTAALLLAALLYGFGQVTQRLIARASVGGRVVNPTDTRAAGDPWGTPASCKSLDSARAEVERTT